MDRGKMFVLGVYTAQRVSDYNNMNKAGIKRHIDNIVVKDTIIENGQNKEVLSIKEREYYNNISEKAHDFNRGMKAT